MHQKMSSAKWRPFCLGLNVLTTINQSVCKYSMGRIVRCYGDVIKWKLLWIALKHWGRVTHICIGNLTIIGSDNGLFSCRRQSITWTNARILLTGPLGTNFSEILIEIHAFPFKKMHLNMSSGKQRPFCISHNVLKHNHHPIISLGLADAYMCQWTGSSLVWRQTINQTKLTHCQLNLYKEFSVKFDSKYEGFRFKF